MPAYDSASRQQLDDVSRAFWPPRIRSLDPRLEVKAHPLNGRGDPSRLARHLRALWTRV